MLGETPEIECGVVYLGGTVQAADTAGWKEKEGTGPAPELHSGPDREILLVADGGPSGRVHQWLPLHLTFTFQWWRSVYARPRMGAEIGVVKGNSQALTYGPIVLFASHYRIRNTIELKWIWTKNNKHDFSSWKQLREQAWVEVHFRVSALVGGSCYALCIACPCFFYNR